MTDVVRGRPALCALLAALAFSLAPMASADAAVVGPVIAREWRFDHRVVKDTGNGFGNIVGARYSQELDFYRCRDCAVSLGFFAPGVGRQKRMPLRRKGGMLRGSFSCRHPCGGRLQACTYALSIRMKIVRTRNFEGLAVAVRASGTVTVRQRSRCRRRAQTTVTRFKARRLTRLESGPAHVIAVPGEGCDSRVQSFEAEASSPDFLEKPGEPMSYSWEFGDGTTSTEAKPTHTYPANQRYRATVVIRLDDGSLAKGATDADATDTDPCLLHEPG